MKVDISFIYVNYYCLNDISNSINSIKNTSSSSLNYEFIIVSNSIEENRIVNTFKKKIGESVFLQLEKNFGFAYANNRGVERSTGKYVFIINPDTIFTKNSIEFSFDLISKNRDLGIIAPALITEHGTPYPSVMNDINILTLVSWLIPLGDRFLPKKIRSGRYHLDKSTNVAVAQASALLLNKKTYQKVGGMSEKFFMYCEERDLCLKIRSLGSFIYYYKDSKIIHIGGVSTKALFSKMEIEKHRSRKIFLDMHSPKLLVMNRIFGTIAYSSRFLISRLFSQKEKAIQFKEIMYWYYKSYS